MQPECPSTLPPGLYVVTQPLVTVTAELACQSDDVAQLKEGAMVQVDEVAVSAEDERIRGRIGEPQGWISLRSLEGDNIRWAENVEEERGRVHKALRECKGRRLDVPYAAIRRVLRRGNDRAQSAHQAITKTWRTPLSLFDAEAEAAAVGRGTPAWALECVRITQQLVGEAAELQDYADVYDAQLVAAAESGRGLHLPSLLAQVDRLDSLAHRFDLLLSSHAGTLSTLCAARAAIDSPAAAMQVSPIELSLFVETVPSDEVQGGDIAILQPDVGMGERFSDLHRHVLQRLTSDNASQFRRFVDEEADHLTRCQTAEPRLQKVRVRSGKLVDEIRFEFSDGSDQRFPYGLRGIEREPFELRRGEFLVKIQGRRGWCLDAIKFITNRGRESVLYGNTDGGSPFVLCASPCSQIWGLERDVLGKVSHIVERPVPERYLRHAQMLGGGWWAAGVSTVASTEEGSAQLTSAERLPWHLVRGSPAAWLAVDPRSSEATRIGDVVSRASSTRYLLHGSLKRNHGPRRRWTLC